MVCAIIFVAVCLEMFIFIEPIGQDVLIKSITFREIIIIVDINLMHSTVGICLASRIQPFVQTISLTLSTVQTRDPFNLGSMVQNEWVDTIYTYTRIYTKMHILYIHMLES